MASNGGKKATIRVSLAAEESSSLATMDEDIREMEQALAATASNFFNELALELGGTTLSFEDMMLTDKGREPSVMLSLTIEVKKLPSPKLEF